MTGGVRLGPSHAAGVDGCAGLSEAGIAENLRPSLGGCQGDLGALGDHRAFLFGQRREQM
jgi:hypothetical protein